jgi:7,8-dihydropterin-6-yl-methyl-4-(beta-D-ribofuranosyl)aminobenzene 5'-phosphate synthase
LKVHIITMSENTAGSPGVLAEYGLSTLIETENASVLLDTGQSVSVVHNAGTLGVDLRKVDKIVLSHGHFDHTGGLREVLGRMRKKVDVVAHPDVWTAKYDRHEGHPARYIGIPFARIELESLGAQFVMSRGPVKLAENIMTTGEVPMRTDYESIDPHLFIKEGEDLKPDKLLDDRSVIVTTPAGLIVVLGCAHRGMINTLYHAQELTGVKKISMVLGGSHLIGAGEERVWQTIAALKELGVGRLGLCHCTSQPVAAVMAREFGEGFFFNATGHRVEVEE